MNRKKLIIILASFFCAVFLLAGCNKSGTDSSTSSVSGESAAGTADMSETERGDPEYSLTLMVYMIGSDLESGSASATKDMEEMAASGANLSGLNLVVYTGGSAKWHSDVPEDKNAVFLLTENGFEKQTEFEMQSMGEADSLTRFMEYAADNYPADRYALIMWDHGNGPLMGYGVDKKYGNDSLTLPEIDAALSASPFGPDRKLAFIGFDACLMSSAELICTVADYADYMIASQETEPGFGWNYQFLKDAGYLDTPGLASSIVDNYISFSEDYFAEREFFRSDVTLAAIDLSYADELQEAINAVFDKAADSVSGDYPKLAVQRVQTKAFGRASTGSEYDLVDVESLMNEMSDKYGSETKTVLDLVEKMVVASGSNTDNCCGFSIYYPYYNKSYYKKSWSDEYRNLSLFPGYETYLSRYEQIWLGTDMEVYFSESMVPSVSGGGSYTLELTPEQQEVYADARYYVLRRTGDQLYMPIFVSADVTEEDGTLTANYPGKAIYVTDGDGQKFIPVAKQTDSYDRVTHYTLMPHVDEGELDSEYQFTEIQMALDGETEELTVMGIYKKGEEEELATGKKEEINLSDWKRITFMNVRASYITRDENGIILPFFDWPQGDWITGFECYLTDGISFTYEPVYDDGFEYFIMFEVSDVQNNRYSSELLPITLAEAPIVEKEYPVIESEMEEGASSVTWLDTENVKAQLVFSASCMDGRKSCLMRVENNNDFQILVSVSEFLADGRVSWDNGPWISVDPHTVRDYSWNNLMEIINLEGRLPESLEFIFSVRNEESKGKIVPISKALVKLPENAAFTVTLQPIFGMASGKKLLSDAEGVNFCLEGMGYPEGSNYAGPDSDYSSIYLLFSVENTAKEERMAGITDMKINGEEFFVYEYKNIPPGKSMAFSLDESRSSLAGKGIENIEEISFTYTVFVDRDPVSAEVISLKPSENPESVTLPDVESGEKRSRGFSFDDGISVYDKDGISVSLFPYKDQEDGRASCMAVLENTAEKAVAVSFDNLVINGRFAETGYNTFTLDPGETEYRDLDSAQKTAYMLARERIQSISCDMVVEDYETYEEIDSRKVQAEFPASAGTAVSVLPVLGARAREQVLLDNDSVRITLLGCGGILGHFSSNPDLSGVLYFENKTDDKQLPVGIDGVALNGFSVDFSGNKTTLQPHRGAYIDFYVTTMTLEKQEITSLADISLLLIANEEELTGTVNYSGGSWYQLELSEKGNADIQEDFGELLLDNGSFRVYNRGQSTKDISDWSDTYADIAYFWDLMLVNDSDDNAEFRVTDVRLNGEPDTENQIYLTEDVGAHTRRLVQISDYYFSGDSRPVLTFKPQLRTLGGGTILYTGDDITIRPDGND